MVNRTNFTEIAKEAGVSVATVSRAINGKGPVKEATRRRIMQIAHEQGLWGDHSNGGKGAGTLIGAVVPELHCYFHSALLRGIDDEATKNNCRLAAVSSHNEEAYSKGSLAALVEAKVDGLIVMMPDMHDETRSYLSSLPMPVIFLNPPDHVKGHSSLWIDDYQGAYAATEHLIGHGYRELGIITGPAGALDSAERLRGFEDAMRSGGLSLRPELMAEQDFHREGGRHGFARLMSQRNKPDAIFCCNDMMAIGAIEEARALRVKVPGDVAIVGFDDVDISSLIIPALTTVHVPVQEIGARAVRHLLETLAALPPDRLVITEKISTGLIVRESCGCRRGR